MLSARRLESETVSIESMMDAKLAECEGEDADEEGFSSLEKIITSAIFWKPVKRSSKLARNFEDNLISRIQSSTFVPYFFNLSRISALSDLLVEAPS